MAEETKSDTSSGRFRAPVSYRAIRRAYNTMRALAGAGIAAGATFVWATSDVASAPWTVIAGLLITADGAYRRHRGTSVQPLLIIDITIAGTLLLTQGHTPAIEAAGFVYVLTAALLLLNRREALALIGFAVAWVVPVAVFAPLASDAESTHVVLESAGAAAFVAIIGQLLLSTGRALHQADERQREALETKRRAVEIKN